MLAREVADEIATPDRPRFVLGSVGPGTKLPTLGHEAFARLRDAYAECGRGLVAGGADAIVVETCQDLLQAKAAILGVRRAMAAEGRRVPIVAQVAVETTGTMLLGSEIGAALTALEALGVDLIGLNCSTGPAEMSEHLRTLSKHARIPLSVMPNAGLPELGPNGAEYPLTPDELAAALTAFVNEYGAALVGGCCGTTPEHIATLVEAMRGLARPERHPRPEPGVSSLYAPVPFRQDTSVLMIGERTNANGSKKFREAMLAEDWEACVGIAREQTREGAHLIDLCVDYVGRDGVADMAELAGRLATASTLPVMLDSTEPEVLRAGLERLGGRCDHQLGELRGRRRARVALPARDGAGRRARRRGRRAVHRRGGPGPHRGVEGPGGRAADRGPHHPPRHARVRHRRRHPDLPDHHRAGGGAPRRARDHRGDPRAQAPLSRRADHARRLQRLVRPQRRRAAGAELGVPARVRERGPGHRDRVGGEDPADGQDPRRAAFGGARPRLRPRRLDANPPYDPLNRFMELFEGVSASSAKAGRAEELAALPLFERLERRIVDGERLGLEADLDAALASRPALEIINDTLLAGMKTVGELFGAGLMQLPFVLASAEVMKAAVAHLEPHMERTDGEGKGTIVLATVKGDVHDIGKNLVDIILTNNGYTVVNLGIKQPISTILTAATEHRADAIGMSGLLVKSTVIMKENLQEMNARGVAELPVLLGGAALTRSYVENDLSEIYEGRVSYARDAFEGLRLMDATMARRRGGAAAVDPAEEAARAERKARHERSQRIAAKRKAAEAAIAGPMPTRSDVASDNPIPTPPFWGTRVVKGVAVGRLRGDGRRARPVPRAVGSARRARRVRPVLRGAGGDRGPPPAALLARPAVHRGGAGARRRRLRLLPGRLRRRRAGRPRGAEARRARALPARVPPPAPRPAPVPRRLLAAAGAGRGHGEVDVLPLHLVTMGQPIADYANELFAKDAYRDYLEVHGLGVQLTEALAECWHRRIREELRFADATAVAAEDPDDVRAFFDLGYRGARYSLGYGACPNLDDRVKIVDLLQPERIGVTLSEELQLHPGAVHRRDGRPPPGGEVLQCRLSDHGR